MSTAVGALVLLVLSCAAEVEEDAAGSTMSGEPSPRRGSLSATAGLGEGFLVWESSRTGRWRLWTRNLAGGPPRQLTPDEGRRLHCCPHVSPDGEWIAYMSLAPDQKGYPRGGAVGPLRIIRPDGTDQRQLVARARNYYENRAVVWRSPTELIYIEPDGRTALLDLATGESELLTRQAEEEHPWLIDSRLGWAASGNGAFSPYDPERLRVAERAPTAGCQPYFSHDGRWGFWVVAPGGPIDRIRLDSGETGRLLRKSDPRLPPGLGYLYFPMLSRDGRLFAFAASADQHDHFEADYDIFVFEVEAERFELVGDPIRFTDHPATDRFPDIHGAPLALGRHSGEAPFLWTHRPAGPERAWRWSYGDGRSSSGPMAEHTFEQAGRFEVRAAFQDRLLRGQVVVAPPRPPEILSTRLLENGLQIALVFDEPVVLHELEARLESGIAVRGHRLEREGHLLSLQLAAAIRRPDRLHLAGLTDRARPPNPLPPTQLSIEPPLWPVNRDGLAFLWETGDAPNLLYDAAQAADVAVILTPRGTARLDHDFAMAPSGGHFEASDAMANRVTEMCQASYELTLEAVVTPESVRRDGSGVILTASRGGRMNFTLEQQGRHLVFGVRMSSRGEGAFPRVRLFELPADRSSHVLITYEPGRLAAYLDGELRHTETSIRDGFFHWRPAALLFGADWDRSHSWQGRAEGVAIYNRVLGAEEARENALRYRDRLDDRPELERWLVRARRTVCSATPSLEEITPYREALSVCEYHIEEIRRGPEIGPRLRVARWSILDGARLEGSAGEATLQQLELTRFEDNPQLESVYLADTLETPSDRPLFYLEAE